MSLEDKDDDRDENVEVGGQPDEEVFIADEDESKGKDKGAKGSDDERLGADPDAPTQEEVENRRQQRRDKRKRQREWVKRDRRELDFMHQEVGRLNGVIADLQRGQGQIGTQTQLGRIDSARAALQAQLKEVDELISASVTASDGEGVIRANGVRDQIRDKMGKLDRARETIVASSKDEGKGGETAQAEAIQTAQRNAQIFAGRHPWFDGQNKDSKVAKRLDAELRREGYSPDQKNFWEELEDRMKEELPHRFKDKDGEEDDDDDDDDNDGEQDIRGRQGSQERGNDGRAKGGPAIGKVAGSKDGVNGRKGTTYKISAERKQAMVDAGIWDDIPHRNRMIKKYAEYDRQHGIKN